MSLNPSEQSTPTVNAVSAPSASPSVTFWTTSEPCTRVLVRATSDGSPPIVTSPASGAIPDSAHPSGTSGSVTVQVSPTGICSGPELAAVAGGVTVRMSVGVVGVTRLTVHLCGERRAGAGRVAVQDLGHGQLADQPPVGDCHLHRVRPGRDDHLGWDDVDQLVARGWVRLGHACRSSRSGSRRSRRAPQGSPSSVSS